MSFISIHGMVGRYMYVATKREREREPGERERERERVCVRYTDKFMLHSARERAKKEKREITPCMIIHT